jgi:hypothetical protein
MVTSTPTSIAFTIPRDTPVMIVLLLGSQMSHFAPSPDSSFENKKRKLFYVMQEQNKDKATFYYK